MHNAYLHTALQNGSHRFFVRPNRPPTHPTTTSLQPVCFLAMPAKKRCAETQAASSKKKAKNSDSQATVNDVATLGKALQAPHLVKVHKALNTIRNCKEFEGIGALPALTIAEGGTEAPLIVADCKTALQNAAPKTQYKAAGSFMSIDHTWLVNHRIPVNPGQIAHIQKTKFPSMNPPGSIPFRLVIAVAPGEYLPTVIAEGSLARISPEEIGHAMLFSIEEAIEQKAPAGILERWKNLIRSFPFAFEAALSKFTGCGVLWFLNLGI